MKIYIYKMFKADCSLSNEHSISNSRMYTRTISVEQNMWFTNDLIIVEIKHNKSQFIILLSIFLQGAKRYLS